MNFDFPTILVTATFVTGLIWRAMVIATGAHAETGGSCLGVGGKATDQGMIAATLKYRRVRRSFFPVIVAVLLFCARFWLSRFGFPPVR